MQRLAFLWAEALLYVNSTEAQVVSQKLGYSAEGRETVDICCIASLTGAWNLTDTEQLRQLAPFHVWNEAFQEKRVKWRAGRPLTVIF